MKKVVYDENAEKFWGDRGEAFMTLIMNLLMRSRLNSEDRGRLLFLGMDYFKQAFTSRSADPETNYECFEQIGDMFVNTFIVNYTYKRFPQLETPAGVQVVARVRIKYGSRENLFQIGDALGLWPFISASVEQRHDNRKSLIEDVFEAIMGAIGRAIDDFFLPNRSGYRFVYNILESIFDERPMSLKYIDLCDKISILKETFDYFKDSLGKQKKEYSYDEETQLCTCRLYRVIGSTTAFMGQGLAARQPDAEQRAAGEALTHLHRAGFRKPEPPVFELMNNADPRAHVKPYMVKFFRLTTLD